MKLLPKLLICISLLALGYLVGSYYGYNKSFAGADWAETKSRKGGWIKRGRSETTEVIVKVFTKVLKATKKQAEKDKEKWLTFFKEDIVSCFIPKCGHCDNVGTKQTTKGKHAQEDNHRPINWGYYCESCFAKGLEIEMEAIHG